jgi:hypothetical protein
MIRIFAFPSFGPARISVSIQPRDHLPKVDVRSQEAFGGGIDSEGKVTLDPMVIFDSNSVDGGARAGGGALSLEAVRPDLVV